MFFKRISLVFLILTAASVAKSQQQDSVLTLPQCVDLAIKNNLDVKKSATQMERDKISWQQARANLLPTLNGNASQSISFGRSQDPTTYKYLNQRVGFGQYSLSSNVLLSNGMSAINNIKANALAYQAGTMDFQQVKDQTTLTIISLYFAALNAEDQLAQAKLQFEGSRVSLERETTLNDAGSVAPADYYNIKGTHQNDQINVDNATNAVLTAKINLLEAMNVPFTKNIRLVRLTADQVPAVYPTAPDQIYSSALSSLALVKASDLRVKAAEKEVASYRGRLYPTLSLGGSIGTNYSSTGGSFGNQFRNNYSYGPNLNLSIPILNYFQNRNNLRSAKLDLKNAQDNNDFTHVQLKQQIDQAHSNMATSLDRYQVLVDQVKTYQSAFDAQKTKFDAGVITSDIFIIAKNNLDAANVNLINARYDYLIRTKILDYYQGKLSF